MTNYGKQADEILEKIKEFNDAPEVALGRAEAWFGVHHEMVNRAEDFFVRRTGMLYFEIASIGLMRAAVMSDFQKYLNWDDARLQEENKMMDEMIYDATHYYEKELEAV